MAREAAGIKSTRFEADLNSTSASEDRPSLYSCTANSRWSSLSPCLKIRPFSSRSASPKSLCAGCLLKSWGRSMCSMERAAASVNSRQHSNSSTSWRAQRMADEKTAASQTWTLLSFKETHLCDAGSSEPHPWTCRGVMMMLHGVVRGHWHCVYIAHIWYYMSSASNSSRPVSVTFITAKHQCGSLNYCAQA